MKTFKRWLRRLLYALLILTGLAVVAGAIMIATGWTAMGTRATGERKARMEASPQWSEDHFVDVMPRIDPPMAKAAWAFFTQGSDHREPVVKIPVQQRSKSDFAQPPASGLRITWLGHSTFIIEIGGKRLLVDPVWGDRASPFTWAGPKRFYPPPLPFEELPEIDAVVISHDHYDHLDHPTIVKLIEKNVPFIVPLGIGAHLEYWGMPADRIHELEWWQEHNLGTVRLVSTPCRHFSGRFMLDKDATLWTSWAFISDEHRVYFSGDTAMFPGFTEIGEKLGPFDVTLMESGAYNALWADVHLGPEQAVKAHQMVKGRLMMPVHWGLFDLALHGWTEPMERVLVAAKAAGVPVVTPQPGGQIEPGVTQPTEKWWPEVPWDTAEQAPVKSSGL